MKPYEFGDQLYDDLKKKIHQLFVRKRLMDFDEINAASETRSLMNLYVQIDTAAREAFKKLSEYIWAEIMEEEEESEDRHGETDTASMAITPAQTVSTGTVSAETVSYGLFTGSADPGQFYTTAVSSGAGRQSKKEKPDVDSFVTDVLSKPDAVTGYRWDNEVERKRDRLFEAIMANSAKGKREARKKAYDTAERYILKQTQQFMIDVEDKAVLRAYEEEDIRYVEWCTQQDERVCAECDDREGAIYRVDKVPDKHFGCRCYLRGVDPRGLNL